MTLYSIVALKDFCIAGPFSLADMGVMLTFTSFDTSLHYRSLETKNLYQDFFIIELFEILDESLQRYKEQFKYNYTVLAELVLRFTSSRYSHLKCLILSEKSSLKRAALHWFALFGV